MIARAIGDIQPQDLDELIQGARPEGRTLDYKAELPGGSDEEKRKLLADVAAFANTRGGDIVYGVREREAGGVPESVVGVSPASRDQEQLRLEGIIRSGVDPRVPGIEMRWIPHPSVDRQTLVLRVPRSLVGPHMVTYGGISRFYGRGTNGNFLMDVRDVRAAFELSGDFARRLQAFRSERLISLETERPTSGEDRGRIVLHIVPMSAFETGFTVDLRRPPDLGLLADEHVSPNERRHNVDGHLSQHAAIGSLLLLRQGALEATDVLMAKGGSSRRAVPSLTLETALIRRIPEYCRALEGLGVQMPIFVSMSLLGMSGTMLGIQQNIHDGLFGPPPAFDRDVIVLPDVRIDSVSAVALWSQALRPLIDALWQAAGLPGSRNYDGGGTWVPGKGQL